MSKVVYNACYGGFGLSRAATERLAAMGVASAKEHLADPEAVRYAYHARDIPRHDPRLVRAVEEMGEAANGQGAALRVVDLGEGAHAYRIKEHDGQERVEEVYCDGVAFDSSAPDMTERFKAAEAHAAKLEAMGREKRTSGRETQAQRFIGRAEGIREALRMLRKTEET